MEVDALILGRVHTYYLFIPVEGTHRKQKK